MALWRKNRRYDGGPDVDEREELHVRRDDDLRVRQDDDLFVRRGDAEVVDQTTILPPTPQPAAPAVTQTEFVDRPVIVRGGLALGAIVTGTVTAVGAMTLLSAIVGGIVASTDLSPGELRGDITDYGTWAALAFVFAQFFAYLWGGYTAGRMARGMGALNGLMVPIVTLAIGAIVVGVVNALGTDAAINIPFVGQASLPVTDSTITTTGLTIGATSLLAMFAGGIYGGTLGARWHRRLEEPGIRPHERRID